MVSAAWQGSACRTGSSREERAGDVTSGWAGWGRAGWSVGFVGAGVERNRMVTSARAEMVWRGLSVRADQGWIGLACRCGMARGCVGLARVVLSPRHGTSRWGWGGRCGVAGIGPGGDGGAWVVGLVWVRPACRVGLSGSGLSDDVVRIGASRAGAARLLGLGRFGPACQFGVARRDGDWPVDGERSGPARLVGVVRWGR